ncbi:glycosyltransferase [Blastopirellula marina]|uniref:Glycosyltransferase n=1 Tax=Blastopirellula marina TaxID=124 RepID=A0A2S8GD69_9BACT|nr:glycosyltransferase [Blastopirellula marina]PQO42406.1 hypothetical protein C5Y93_29185 [Blastopirellula marina]
MPDASPTPPETILIVATELGMGGAERCVANLACHLDRQKYAVHVVALAAPPSAPKDGLVHQLSEAGIPLTFLNCRSSWQLWSAITKLKQIVRDTQPTVVWSFLFHANVVSALVTRGMNVARLQSLRVIEQGKWRRKLQAWAARGADAVLCVSEGVRVFAEQTLHLPSEKLQVIPNGIDLAAISPSNYEAPEKRPYRILAVGRLDRQKGFDWLIPRTASLLRQLPEWELVIIGDGPEQAKLASQIEAEGMQRSIRLVGWTNSLANWFSSCEIYVLSSRWEGMPNTLIEAMAYGLPAAATDVEGVEQLLAGELSQQIISLAQPEKAEALIGHLMKDQTLRMQLGKLNRKRIESDFSLRQMVQLHEVMLDDVISTHLMHS